MSEPQLLAAMKSLVDPDLGVIRWIVEARMQPDEPPLHIGMCEFTNPMKLKPARIADDQWQRAAVEEARQRSDVRAQALNPVGRKHATGAGGDRVSALWATVGEACERYAMQLDAGRGALSALEAELEGEIVSPSRFILFSDEQYRDPTFPFVRYNAAKSLQWRQALNLAKDQWAWVPAQFISGPLERPEFQILDTMYSTGCAAGSSPAHAVNTGLREVIERDAFMCHWLMRRTPRRIPTEYALQHSPEWLRTLLTWSGVEVELLWLDTDHGVPVVLSLVLPKRKPGVAIGASCHADWRVALEKAVVEAFHTMNWIIDMSRWGQQPPARAEVMDFSDHVAFYLDPSRHGDVGFLRGGTLHEPPVVETPDAFGTQTAWMVERLTRVGLNAYAVPLTPPDLEAVGIHAARVIVPEAHPLHCGVDREHLDPRRLESVAAALGEKVPSRLNHDLHPFP